MQLDVVVRSHLEWVAGVRRHNGFAPIRKQRGQIGGAAQDMPDCVEGMADGDRQHRCAVRTMLVPQPRLRPKRAVDRTSRFCGRIGAHSAHAPGKALTLWQQASHHRSHGCAIPSRFGVSRGIRKYGTPAMYSSLRADVQKVAHLMSDERPPNFSSVWSDLTNTSFSQGFVNASGVRTRYLMAGNPDKPLLLLLHGTGGHAEAYSRNLAAHAEHFWTIAIDMIGHGWTDKPLHDYQIRHYAKHVTDTLHAFGRDRAHISGESLGGWVATHLAVHSPEVVNRMVLNTAGGWTAHPEVMARLRLLSMEAAEDPNWSRIRTRLQFLMYDKSMVSDDLIETRRAIYAQKGFPDVMRRILCLQDMEIRRANMFSAQQYRSIRTPTMVVWTSHDPTATPEEGRQISEMIPDCRFVVMNKCGHWPQFENAEEFNRLHIEFLLGM